MLTSENLIVILYALPIYQLLFYVIQLISFKKSNPSRKYLGLLLLSMTIFLLINVFFKLGSMEVMLRIYPFYIPLLLTLPPVFFLYIFSLAKEKEDVKGFSKLILFIPAIIVLILNVITYSLSSVREREIILMTDPSPFQSSFIGAGAPLIIVWLSLLVFLVIQVLFAFFRIRNLLANEKEAMQKQPAHLAYLQFRWIYTISLSLLIFIVASGAQILFSASTGLTVAMLFNLTALVAGGLTGYFGMKQDNLLNEVSKVGSANKQEFTVQSQPEMVEKSDSTSARFVPEEEANMIMLRIELLMTEKKPYLNKRFSIDNLSKMIEFRKNKVTFVINEIMGKNFHGLVNDYRVKEAMTILETDGSDLTMDAVADMAGFHSRSSFYACFKKYTGQTPREFVLDLKQNGDEES